MKPPGRSASTSTGEQVWKAFALPGEPPDPVGVFAHEPSPYAGKTAGYLRTFVVLAWPCCSSWAVAR